MSESVAEVIELTQICRTCGKPRLLTEMPFISRVYTTRDGQQRRYRSRTCQYCRTEKKRPINSRSYQADKERVLASNPALFMYRLVKRHAREKGVPFDLSPEDIFIPEFCPVLGIKLSPPGDGLKDSSPTVDRLIASKGYVRGNIAVISSRADRIKSDATLAEFEKIYAWFRSQVGPKTG
jgi:hypothetical protein